ncbi:hypothetical protein GCM10009133_37140 [Cocleimonas flava]|uniref:Diguanylate cyclase (GGDEF)-like protein n=1 Tax=Cocleimonas flava TaxID=634765 RepID=A0A4R1F2P2_9GAMM|nr:EAL domain-containing protein [Cocleimonas flava]TCJ88447.1 diguanylate cyclase (GGDEF)-like protein [Cocleimonas flava]
MTLISTLLHRYILSLGFAVIIILMICTTLFTSSLIGKTRATILQNQSQINERNKVLDVMASANLERSHTIFKLAQSRDPADINVYIKELYKQSVRFNEARKEYNSLKPSEAERELLSLQAVMTIQNILKINEVIDNLMIKDFKKATDLVNEEVLPRNKHVISLIEKLHTASNNNAHANLEQSKFLTKSTYQKILAVQFFSIILIFIFLFYLGRKQRKSDENLSTLANTDTLTALPNRASFIKNINQTISESDHLGATFSIVFLDIDYFKSINDIYGHEVGDEVLKLFSATIKNQIAPDDVIARFGGDEFVLILKNTANENHASDLIKNLSNALDTSFHINSNEVFISASIGASAYPKDGSNAKQLLKNADIAMYTAKNAGRNCYQFYSLKNSQKLEYEHALSHALQTILKNNNRDKNFQLVYQPLVNIDDNDFNECEALIRWKDKNGNNVNTSEFIQIAEKSNLIEKVNLFVIEEACRQQAEWQKQGIKNIRININLSGNKRIFENLFESLAENVSRYNLDPKLFGIELTERTMYEISEKSIVNLTHFRDLGMKIAIDDFGTGYSSLSYLKDLPITSLKIDRKFTAGLPTEKVDIALVKSIITLAHSLDYDVIAEGVETQAQFDFLKSYKCNIAQGYLLHRPLSSEAISELKLAA